MDLLHEYFLMPIMMNGWFNPVNSIVYGLGLVAGGWLVYRLLLRLRIGIDMRLFVSLLPFIAFAGVTRTLRDYVYSTVAGSPGLAGPFSVHMQTVQQAAYGHIYGVTGNALFASLDSHIIAWFPTPGSYLITAMLALVCLGISMAVQRYGRVPYWKSMFALGTILFLANALMLPVHSYVPLAYIGLVSMGWTAMFFGVTYMAEKGLMERLGKRANAVMRDIFTRINSTILSAHFFDATATYFAIALFSTAAGQGYTEQHFLSRWMMPFLGPQVMFLLKFVVVVPVLYYINRYVEDKRFRNFLLLVIFILGLAPATRNLARLMVGV